MSLNRILLVSNYGDAVGYRTFTSLWVTKMSERVWGLFLIRVLLVVYCTLGVRF